MEALPTDEEVGEALEERSHRCRALRGFADPSDRPRQGEGSAGAVVSSSLKGPMLFQSTHTILTSPEGSKQLVTNSEVVSIRPRTPSGSVIAVRGDAANPLVAVEDPSKILTLMFGSDYEEHFCNGGQAGASYVGMVEESSPEDALTPDELARVRRARGQTEEALDLERDVRRVWNAVDSTPCTCKGSHGREHTDALAGCAPKCAKRLAKDRADRLQKMEDMVTGRTKK